MEASALARFPTILAFRNTAVVMAWHFKDTSTFLDVEERSGNKHCTVAKDDLYNLRSIAQVGVGCLPRPRTQAKIVQKVYYTTVLITVQRIQIFRAYMRFAAC